MLVNLCGLGVVEYQLSEDYEFKPLQTIFSGKVLWSIAMVGNDFLYAIESFKNIMYEFNFTQKTTKSYTLPLEKT